MAKAIPLFLRSAFSIPGNDGLARGANGTRARVARSRQGVLRSRHGGNPVIRFLVSNKNSLNPTGTGSDRHITETEPARLPFCWDTICSYDLSPRMRDQTRGAEASRSVAYCTFDAPPPPGIRNWPQSPNTIFAAHIAVSGGDRRDINRTSRPSDDGGWGGRV